jgi:chemotaxis protein methyltransferase CheR
VTTGADVARFRSLLAARLGWAFTDADGPHLDTMLSRRTGEHGIAAREYLARLGAGWPDEMVALAQELTITETYLFRHSEQFAALREAALPERVAARSGQRLLRLLSVGCSSGEEAYSLAIVAREVQPDPGWIVDVLGVDANAAMLAKAAAGRYSAWSLRETPDTVRERWFHSDDGDSPVDPSIRGSVRFRQYNVADDDPALWRPGQYDVVFCRNLLMYLTRAAAASLVERMTLALAPGGYLFLGHTDSLGSRPGGLELVHTHHAFYYRRPTPTAAPPHPMPTTPPHPAPGAAAGDVTAPPAAQDGYERALSLLAAERFTEALHLVETLLGDRPRPRELLLHGVLLAQAGRLEDAEIAGRRLLDADGLYADAHHLLGVCLEGGAGVDVAIGHYRLAAYLDPGFAMPRLRLGLLARRRGDHRAAGTELEQALALLHGEGAERIALFGGGFGRTALSVLCRAELDAIGARR